MFGIVSDSEFDKQLETLNEKQERAKVLSIQRGRNRGEVPQELRKIIAGSAISGVPASELSATFGVSESSISAYKNGATSTTSYNEPNEDLKQHNDVVRSGILDKARGKLTSALEQITEDKLADCKVRDVAGIARDMSAIIRNLEPQSNIPPGQLNQQIIFYAPREKKETDFEMIEVN